MALLEIQNLAAAYANNQPNFETRHKDRNVYSASLPQSRFNPTS